MASHVIGGQRWPEGTVVGAYFAAAWVDKGRSPSGQAQASATVSGGIAAFSGLAEDVRYVAWASSVGVTFLISSVSQQPVGRARTDRERILELEEAPASGETLPAVATEEDLPALGDPPLMVFVRRDSTALDDDGNPLPALYLWTGSTWVRGGLAGGGGSADTDTYYVELDLEGNLQDGQTVRWADGDDNFIPGVLVPE